jgi:hydrogenase maturation protease
MNSDELEGPGPTSEKLIIGIGNEFRSDDGVGLYLSRKLKEMNLERVRVVEAGGEGTELMGIWENKAFVVVIDAIYSGAEPGKIYRFDPIEKPLSETLFGRHSTHAFGLAGAVELSRTLGSLPQKLIIFGIEGKTFEAGIGLSNKVINAADSLILEIKRDVT